MEVSSRVHGSKESKAEELGTEGETALPAEKALGNNPSSSASVENDDEIHDVEPLHSIVPQTEKDVMIVELMLRTTAGERDPRLDRLGGREG